MKTDELREKYLDFFVSKGHKRCASDVLVPTWDPSVLFTPAGMNPFKDHFLGKVKLEFTKATSCQKCLRTGDIDNVGRTAYHHTFFEMLGNFSFGDYFKREAINWAWEFLTSKKWLGMDPSTLSVTVYMDDDEAAGFWQNDIGLKPERIERMGEADNFWPASSPSQGPDGVCGPCSEIFVHDGKGGSVEIWNLVFTQFNRVGDPPDNLRPLPSKNIDTGMGLERAASVLQGVDTNYHIDILKPIVLAAGEITNRKYDPKSDDGRRLRRITDHVRACTFAVHENVYPGAQKEKYVIRRLLRRAVLDGHRMGMEEAFLYRLVPSVVEMMKVPYPELAETAQRVADVIKKEEENFLGTLDAGLAKINKIFDDMKAQNRTAVDGEEAADLYQTYGVPPELFENVAAENNLAFDWDGFRRAMGEHGEASGKLTHVVMGDRGPLDAIKRVLHDCEFLGYETTEAKAELKFIVAQEHLCDQLTEVSHDKEIQVVLDRSPFYGESGGQVGDTGEIVGKDFKFKVINTQRDGGLIIHIGHLVEGEMRTGVEVTARVDTLRRGGIRRAHSATHILHHALQKTLGTHAQQQGSKVDADWLRFDFTNMAPVSPEQLDAIQKIIDERVKEAAVVKWETLPLAEARKAGAMMLFGEKYPDPVRMVSMGEFSRELCGGTHLTNTAEVESFEILSEEGVAAGTRRIVALTGVKAREHESKTKEALQELVDIVGVPVRAVPAAVKSMLSRLRDLKKAISGAGKVGERETVAAPNGSSGEVKPHERKSLLAETARALNVPLFDAATRVQSLAEEITKLEEELHRREAAGPLSADDLIAQAEEIAGTKVVVLDVPGGNANLMRQLIDQIRRKTTSSAILLGASQDDKVTLVAGISRDLVEKKLSAGEWVKSAAQIVGGSGGGKPDMAQAGGKDPTKLPEALANARKQIGDMLKG